jgi:glycosyltransferase involved in cell wall biosynthesis
MIVNLSDYITIVIPCKNEKNIISKTLDLLNHQENIENTNVIICDDSDDNQTKEIIKERKKDKFIIKLIDGGLPSVARNKGARLVKTPYILFLDADVFLVDSFLIHDIIKSISNKNIELTTCRFVSSTGKFNYIFNLFYYIQRLTKFISPFAIGGFILINTDKFNQIGGFDESFQIAEDYQLTRKINHKKFKIFDRFVFTTPRRFENKGLLYMLKIFIFSFFKRNNKEYFKDDKNYWK